MMDSEVDKRIQELRASTTELLESLDGLEKAGDESTYAGEENKAVNEFLRRG